PKKEKISFGTTTQVAGEVGINEGHWYKNHVPLAAQSGGEKEEGEDILAWGKLELVTATLGTIICQNEFGGYVYNAGGAGVPKGGNAVAGAAKIDAFQAMDCSNVECESTLKSKEFIESEGLGITV